MKAKKQLLGFTAASLSLTAAFVAGSVCGGRRADTLL